VRYSDITWGAKKRRFLREETLHFLGLTSSHYCQSYGDRRDQHKRPDDGEVHNAQKANADMVYCFKCESSDESLKAPQISFPPTKEELFSSNGGRAGDFSSSTRNGRTLIRIDLQDKDKDLSVLCCGRSRIRRLALYVDYERLR